MAMPPRQPRGSHPGDPGPPDKKKGTRGKQAKGRKRPSKLLIRLGKLLILLIGSGGLTAILVAYINRPAERKAADEAPKKEPRGIIIEDSAIPGNIIQGDNNRITQINHPPSATLQALVEKLSGNRDNLKQAIADWAITDADVRRRLAGGEIDQKEASRLLEQARGQLLRTFRHNRKLFSGSDWIAVSKALSMPDHCEVLYLGGQYEKAIACYSDVIRANLPRSEAAKAYEMRGRSHDRINKTKEAIDDLTESLRIESRNVSALCARGRIFFFKKRYKEAIADYTQALYLDDESVEAYQGRGETYFEMQDFDRAIADYESAIAIDASSAWSYTHRGWNYARRGWRKERIGDVAGLNADHARALEDFTQAIEKDPTLALAYKYRAEVNRSLADSTKQRALYAKIVTDTSQAIELYGKRVPETRKELRELYNLRSYAHEMLGDRSQAEADRERAKSYKP